MFEPNGYFFQNNGNFNPFTWTCAGQNATQNISQEEWQRLQEQIAREQQNACNVVNAQMENPFPDLTIVSVQEE